MSSQTGAMTKIILLITSVFTFFISDCGQTSSTSVKNSSIAHTIRIKVGKAPGSIEVADFNNDKLPDLAITSEADTNVTILLGMDKGKFSEAAGSPFFAGHSP